MGFASFSIILDNPSGFFSPGQTVTGNVLITNNQVETLKGIHAEFSGKAKVKIPGKESNKEEEENPTSPPKEEFFCDKEKYFEIKYSLYNSGSKVFDLSIGQHAFPFTFVLPMQIPSSFEGKFGHVRYIIEAVAQRPIDDSKYECKASLVVCSNLDLNTITGAALPVSKMKSKKICCLCCASGPICAQVRIERAGYVPGETIFVNADTENNSGRRMNGSRVQFVQIARFIAEGKTETDSKVLVEFAHGEFTDSDIMENVPLVVPPLLPPSDLPFCGIISVSYQVQYVVDPGSFSFSLDVPLDVIIGTVPLYNSASFAHGIANTSDQHIGFAPIPPPGIPNTSDGQVGFNHWAMPNWQGGGPGAPTAPPPLDG